MNNNHEKIKQAFGNIKAPENMAQKILATGGTQAFRTPKRNNKLIRVMLIAVISVFMTATALAVVIPELLQGGRIFVRETEDMDYLKAAADLESHTFSENLRKYIQNTEAWYVDEDNFKTGYQAEFNSFEEASDFFGFPIIMPDGFEYESTVRAWIIVDTKNTEKDSAVVNLFARLSDIAGENPSSLFYHANFAVGYQPDGGTVEFASWLQPEELSEIYVSPANGIEAAVIVHIPDEINASSNVQFNFSINEVFYMCSMYDVNAGRENAIIEILKNIVDSIK